MIPHLVYYQLVILVLLWLCVMLPHLWPSPPGGMPKTLGLNNLRANGHPNGGPWCQFHCTSCDGFFPEHHGTMFHGKQATVELIVHVLACLAEGLGIRATARVFEVDANTVLQWLVEAAEQLTAFSAYVLCDVWLDDQHRLYRTAKSGHPPAGGGGGPSGQHLVPGRGRLTLAAGSVPRVLQFLPAPCELAPAVVAS